MHNRIETHGWNDLITPTDALFDLDSRALKLYIYLIFRARDKESAYPSQDKVASDLSSGGEKWSGPTVKRAFAELVAKHWIIRQRRVGTSSLTHLFKSRDDCKAFARRIAEDPTVRSQKIRQSDRIRSEKENSVLKEDSNNNAAPANPRKSNPFFDAVCEVCGLDPRHLPPKLSGSGVAKVIMDLKASNWGVDDVKRYHAWRKSRNMQPLGSVYWLVTEMAKKDWRNGGGNASSNKTTMTAEQREAHERYLAQRRQAQEER